MVTMTVAGGQSATTAANAQAVAGDKINELCGIKEVYASNLYDEFDQIRRMIDQYCFVAMDTEFPGVVARPIGEFKSTADYQYQLLRCNVDLLKLIQVGLTFLSEKGEMPPKFTTWQFNFKFSLGEDMYAQDSIDLLTNSGIRFKKHEEDGIDFLEFAELLMTSGLVLSEKVKWISFHSGYDFGYLLKLLTNCQLPADENEFFELLQIYFPAIYDVKYVMKSCRSLKGGLQEVADQLKVDRIGPQHQAGSDSLLTGLTFFRMKQLFFEDSLDDGLYCGHLFGLGAPYGNGADAAAPPVPVLDPAKATPLHAAVAIDQTSSSSALATPSAGGASVAVDATPTLAVNGESSSASLCTAGEPATVTSSLSSSNQKSMTSSSPTSSTTTTTSTTTAASVNDAAAKEKSPPEASSTTNNNGGGGAGSTSSASTALGSQADSTDSASETSSNHGSGGGASASQSGNDVDNN